jgi:serine/threonine-protein kinase HipA
LNPNPSKAEHTLTFDGTAAVPDLELVLKTAGFYRLENRAAQRVRQEVEAAVSRWPELARRLGLSRDEIGRMRSVFQV